MNIEYFNKIAHKWDSMIYHDPKKLNYFFGLLSLEKGDTVLDVGTGTGILIPHIIKRIGKRGRLFAIDISPEMIKIASHRYDYPNLTFLTGDVEEYNFNGFHFDKIICYSVFPHFLHQRECIHKLSTLLSPKGRLSVFHSASRAYINNIHRENGFHLEKNMLPPGKDVAFMMSSSGLSVIHLQDDEEIYIIIGEKVYPDFIHKKAFS